MAQYKLKAVFWIILCLLSCQSFAANLTLSSPAFQPNQAIPKQYTCHGANISPPLVWWDAPQKTQSFVLIVDDPDAAQGTWVHWLVFNIPATLTQLTAGATLPEEALTGFNSWNKKSYRGPCPPSGIHHYYFQLYALDTRLTVNSSVSKADIINAMQHHILAQSILVGVFQH